MNFEVHLMISSRASILQITKDDNLVKVLLREKGKMANVMLEILMLFSSV